MATSNNQPNNALSNLIFNAGSGNTSNLPTIIDQSKEIDTIPLKEEEQTIEYINDNIQKSINQAIKSFENAVLLAEATQAIRVYEALPTYLDSITNANKVLLDILEKKKKLMGETTNNENTPKTQTNIIMTSTEMLENILAKTTGSMKTVNGKKNDGKAD